MGISLRLTRFFTAPPERVFRAWTDPEELKRWWRAGKGWRTPIAEVDLRVGGEFRIGTQPQEGGEMHLVRGTYREVLPARKLVYTFVVEGSEARAEEVVTVEFHAQDAGTMLILSHQRIAEKQSTEAREKGWESVLDHLTDLLNVAR